MRIYFIVLSVLTLLASGIPVHAQDGEPRAAAIDARLERLISGVEPGVAVGVVHNGEIITERYIGYANLEHAVPIGPATRFNIASNAKQYTALMILDLAQKGRVDLDAEFRTYLPLVLPEIETPITIRQLLTHRSGIRDIYDLWGISGTVWYRERLRNREALAMLNRQTTLNFTPGSDVLYSNSNYLLLAEIVAAVSGQSFHDYADAFFAARGMESTGVRRRQGVIVPNLARAYGFWSGWLEDPAIANLHGDGFLYSTLTDQLRWEQQVQGVSPSLPADLIAASQQIVETDGLWGYGYGLEFGQMDEYPVIFHMGSTGGYNAYLLRIPDIRMAVIVMGNSTEIGVAGLARDVAAAVLDREDLAPVYAGEPAELGPVPDLTTRVGRYMTGDGTIIRLSLEDGDLYRHIEGRDPVRLLPEAGNVFAYETLPELKLVFSAQSDAAADFTLMMSSQAPQVARRLPDLPDIETYLLGFEGRFVSAETDAEIVLSHDRGGVFSSSRNGRSRDIDLVGEDYFRSGPYRLVLTRDAAGAVDGLVLDGNRIRNLRFERH